MIERKIKVTYYHNDKTGEWCKDAPAKYDNEYYDDEPISNFWSDEDYQKDSDDPTKSPNRKRFWSFEKHVFSKFTNKGKLSKTELNGLPEADAEIFKADAEKQLAAMLELEKSTKTDTEKALKLANIVNSANWDNLQNKDFAVIKVQGSHSSFYKSDYGAMYEPSEYLTLVPISVAKEAIELQNIRRKHQIDQTFDFETTDYRTKIIRVADHDNHGIYADISTTEDWTKMFNCDFI